MHSVYLPCCGCRENDFSRLSTFSLYGHIDQPTLDLWTKAMNFTILLVDIVNLRFMDPVNSLKLRKLRKYSMIFTSWH